MTATAELNVQKASEGELVNAKTICLVLSLSSFGNRKQASLADAILSQDEPEKEPDKTLLTLTKKLLDSPKIEAIAKHDRSVQTKIRKVAYKSLLKSGVHLIALAETPKVEAILKEAYATRKALVKVAKAAYPQIVAETVARLGVQGSGLDYPTPEEFAASYRMSHSYTTFETPSRLKSISAEIYQQEVEKSKQQVQSLVDEIKQGMRAGMLKFVTHLSERLKPTEDGKAKRLHKSALGHLNDFLASFEVRNATDDNELGALVEKARKLMTGVDKDVLKDDSLVRTKVISELDEIAKSLEPMITAKTREIVFDDDESEAEAEAGAESAEAEVVTA